MNRLKKSQIPTLKTKLLQQQEYKCALCGIDLTMVLSRDICLDHDHKGGHVREAICRNCNGIEGKVFNLANRGKRWRSPAQYLESILAYWNKHAQPTAESIFHPDFKTLDEKRVATNKKARLLRVKNKAAQNVGR